MPALLLLALAAQPAPREGVTLVFFPLEARTGVSAGNAELLTDALGAELRATGAVAQLSGQKDIEQLVGVDHRDDVRSCHDDACMTELAGALGAGFVLTGSVGRVGKALVLNARLVRSADTAIVATASERVEGDNPEALLESVRPVARKLVSDAGLVAATAPVVPEEPPRVSPLRALLRGVGLGGVALGAAGLVLSLTAAAAGVALRAVLPEVTGSGRLVVLWVPGYLGLLTLGAAGLGLTVLLVTGGIAAAVTGLVL